MRYLVSYFAVSVIFRDASSFRIVQPASRQFRQRDLLILSPVAIPQQRPPTHLNAFIRRVFWKSDKDDKEDAEEETQKVPFIDETPPQIDEAEASSQTLGKATESASICIIGGGVSGLAAALTAATKADEAASDDNMKIVLLEASDTLGGRVKSDVTVDGYTLDVGFAVFIEEYPFAKKLLDYNALKLGKFLPGALVKLKDSTELPCLARVADPFREPEDILTAVLAPVGTLQDKLRLLPLIFHVRTNTVEELFAEAETDTLTALKDRWGFSDEMIDTFFRPFLEGIYLAPLEEQSSRMFSFVFKMFSEGSAALPQGGIGAVAKQLTDKATNAGADLRIDQVVTKIAKNEDGFLVQTKGGSSIIQAQTVIVATDGKVAQKILSHVDGFESLQSLPEQPQRCVGCLYYSFDTPVPVQDPILILNGIGPERGDGNNPVNNVCFPSVVNSGYAPDGCGLCSVTVLNDAMQIYNGREEELDIAVRYQLGKWFPDEKRDILLKWELKQIYYIPNAQPGQLSGPLPANVNGGRDCSTYRGKVLPKGMFVCGDHMATATLNGALESGVNAGAAAANAVAKKNLFTSRKVPT